MFSDVTNNRTHSWAECELYGGWLVQINDLEEYNCLLRDGKILEVNDLGEGWYWTDANDVEDLGYWTHAYDGSSVSFFAPTLGCGCTEANCRFGGDAILMNIGGDRHYRGNYCDFQSTKVFPFICEGVIGSQFDRYRVTKLIKPQNKSWHWEKK